MGQKLPVVFKSFEGGQATDLKVGLKNSFAPTVTGGAGTLGTYAIDFRKKPSQFTVLPGLAREDGGIVKDLIQNEVMTSDGTIYAWGNGGNLYKRTTTGVWSTEFTAGVGTAGIDYRVDTDSIYCTSNKHVQLYRPISSSPIFNLNYYGPSYSTLNNTATVGFNVNAYQVGSGNIYTVPTSISESSTSLRYFQSDIEPLSKITVFINAKGTGDWTLTLHDGVNTVLASKTITNTNLTTGANDFSFTNATNGQVRIYVEPNARTYHFHLTSTVADGSVTCSATGDLSTADCEIWADRLIQTNNGLHPIARFQQFECIGNGNYLSVWEPISDPPTNAEWLRHKLVFPSEYEVCGLAIFNEYIAIACERNTSSSTSVPQDGIIFFWDGLSNGYSYFTRIPEGAPYALHEYKNAIYYYAGGALYGIGSPTSTPVKIRTMPGTDTEFSGAAAPIILYPYASTVRRGVHLTAFPSTTTNTSINYGIYSWGSVDKSFPDSFGYSYQLSTGSLNYSASNNLTIGMVKNFGDTLHVAWRDDLNGGYGVDVITNSSVPAPASSYESIIFDNGYPGKRKKGIMVQATFIELPVGASFTLKYKLNRRSSWTYSNVFTATTTDSNSYNPKSGYARFDISNPSYFYEIQVGVDITSGSTTPTFTSLSLVFDDNRDEQAGGGE